MAGTPWERTVCLEVSQVLQHQELSLGHLPHCQWVPLPLPSHLAGARALKVSGRGVEESGRAQVRKRTAFLRSTPPSLLHGSESYSGPNWGGEALYSMRD